MLLLYIIVLHFNTIVKSVKYAFNVEESVFYIYITVIYISQE